MAVLLSAKKPPLSTKRRSINHSSLTLKIYRNHAFHYKSAIFRFYQSVLRGIYHRRITLNRLTLDVVVEVGFSRRHINGCLKDSSTRASEIAKKSPRPRWREVEKTRQDTIHGDFSMAPVNATNERIKSAISNRNLHISMLNQQPTYQPALWMLLSTNKRSPSSISSSIFVVNGPSPNHTARGAFGAMLADLRIKFVFK